VRSAPHVLVIGAGIGGLCLAQGLAKAGISVEVFERDRTRDDRLQGYRLHIDPRGSRALHACLPPPVFDAFVATCGRGGDRFSMLTEQLQEVFAAGAGDAETADPVARDRSASRITLRQVLLTGLAGAVRFDRTFERYEPAPDGRVTAHFADGAAATGDLLVAADGAGSRVRRQYLPHADLVDTGILAVAGKVPLADIRGLLPASLLDGPALIAGPRGCSLFLAVQEFERAQGRADGIGGDAPALPPGLLFDNTADYLMWAFGARAGRYGFTGDPEGLAAATLLEAVLRLTAGWHPRLQAIVRASEPATVTPLRIRTSVPIAPWPATNVTLVGDAIHSMTPYRGIGANIALRDADLLCRNLVAARDGAKTVLAAVGDYEAEMVGYGFAAVRDSRRAMEQATAENPVARAVSRAALRSINAVPPLKRRVFGAAEPA